MELIDLSRRVAAICYLLPAVLFLPRPLLCLGGPCDLGVLQNGKLYNYSLASPIPNYPHGVLSEDGFYKVSVNETYLWFQLCTNMLFNHDPPKCFNCQECGGPSKCGTQCSALVSNDMGGYPVCSSIGRASNQRLALIDERYPNKGVTLTISTDATKSCSLSVSVICDSNGAKGPSALEVLGTCNYATSLRHPSGCAKIISGGGGSGWFGTFIFVILCLLVAYLLAGIVYRYYSLGIRGLDVIPNLEFWLGLPERIRVLLGSWLRRVRGQRQGSRSSYTPIG